ncbi:DeoR/GlpR family DNA-binding transcription regulator [Candidatus Enterococcus willemsii]|uniref:DeoR family transcriptional regulator n=1 Tax=Candidatus Enterococcus willemsii TaxID=1857215 RepID=A0ABQ6YZI8_9ENTE|nr:DeoR/GlpR family DNA-binding transcription regulator [Enterococcus sp. CU12B]KAF1304022.1 DeoR family transcriptional regulator [Enterococcus sp. CU12B]
MAENRKEQILTILKEKKSVRILDLSKKLRVSRETVRKDITEMEEEGLLKKTYGGAVLDEANTETDYERRRVENEEQKSLIADRAYHFIEPGDTIYLDYGTSSYALAKKLIDFEDLTVVTNSIPIVNLLIHSPGIQLIILGGNVRKNEDSLFGTFGLNNAKEIFVDLGFFGCAGIDIKSGVTNYHMGEIEISKVMLHHSKTVILLADETKFGKSALYKTSNLDELDIVITTDVKDLEVEEEFLKYNIEIIKTEGKELNG